MTRQVRHVGAYGICTFTEPDGAVRLLLIAKTRGPYTSLLDLPGGGLEWGEEPETALRREFREETGLTISGATLLDALSHRVRYRAADGADEDLHHVGFLYAVTVQEIDDPVSGAPPLVAATVGEDAGGVGWFALRELFPERLSPFARHALASLNGGI